MPRHYTLTVPLNIPYGFGDAVKSIEIRTRIQYRFIEDEEIEVIWVELDKDHLRALASQIDVTELPGSAELKALAELWITEEGRDLAIENARNGGLE